MNRLVWILAVIVLTAPAAAGDRKIKPLPLEECRSIGDMIGKAAGIPLSARIGKPGLVSGVTGDACLLSGRATGLTIGFAAAEDKVDRSLAGWKHIPDYDADGPFGTVKGFTKGARTVVYSLETDPPAGSCDNIVIADCKVPRRQWSWTLEVVAFVQ